MNVLIEKFLRNIRKNGLLESIKKSYSFLIDGKYGDIIEFKFKGNKSDIKNNIESKYNYQGDLLNIFIENKDNIVHKWHHYIPIYDAHLKKYKNKNIKILEIGVSKGGSLQMWRKYFGSNAIIYGIDINPETFIYNNIHAQVRIGSQVDIKFLKSVVSEMGGIDIVIDDGSHQMNHINSTLNYLFPLLNNNGTYIIEDLHTAYWHKFGGGLNSKDNFFNSIRYLIDDMHHWYHNSKINFKNFKNLCYGIHVYDSIIVLDKNINHIPVHSEVS